MATSVLKHLEDDGELSVFTEGDTVLIACENGHYWLIEAEQHSPETVTRALKTQLRGGEVSHMLESVRLTSS